MEKEQEKKDKRFLIGVIIISVSFFLGWPVLALTGTMALIHGPIWFMIGGGVYGASWVMLGVGFILAGPAGIRYAKELIKKIFRRKKK